MRHGLIVDRWDTYVDDDMEVMYKEGVGFLFLSFRRVLNVIDSFLGNSPASEF